MLKKNNGFSLLEVMIVVLIIGILSMVAYPSYKNYMHRIRITEILNDLQPLTNSLRETVATDEILPGFEESIIQHASHKSGDNTYVFMDKESIQKGIGIIPKYIEYLEVSIPTNNSYWPHMKESRNSSIRIGIDYQSMYGVDLDPHEWGNHPPSLYMDIDVALKMIIDNETKSGLLSKCSIEFLNDTALEHFGLSFTSSLPDVCRSYRFSGGANGLQFKSM